MASYSSFQPLVFGSKPLSPDVSDLPPALQRYARKVYSDAWDAYTAAGCPFGPTDKAMLVWYTFNIEAPAHARTFSDN
ncbi:hypothetical protein [Salisaeta longa]|uniref:hypothetical protein n=1 Tax=Salisaeta longa TaxID=503170 RepID=UPI0003B34561|nr:hypothetical protein [Salisaeta longa]